MPAERVPMRSVREILRLRAEGLSDRAIARSTRLARSTVSDYAGRAVAAGLSWPLPEGLTDTALEALLFVRGGPAARARRKPEPDWASLHRELRRPGVTLMLLWQEYRAGAPEGYGYSRFCELYEEGESRLSPVMRQAHPAGERLVVDYCRQTAEVVDGRARRAGGRALDPGPPAQPALLLAGRTEQRDQHVARRPQWPADAPPRRQSPSAVRRARSAGARPAAGRALRLRRMAPAPGRARLSSRPRPPLLLISAPTATPP